MLKSKWTVDELHVYEDGVPVARIHKHNEIYRWSGMEWPISNLTRDGFKFLVEVMEDVKDALRTHG